MALKIIVICAVFIIEVTSAVDPWTTTDELSSLLNGPFGANRHHVTNSAGKQAAFDFLKDKFQEYGMQVIDKEFTTDKTGLEGMNLVGMWPGRLTGTRLDRPIMLTAHYDSARDRAAVQDNGSGLAALAEAARLITSQPCMQEYLVVFAALDFEIQENPDVDGAACYNGYCGSKAFVEQVMVRYLDELGIDLANIHGVIIMDSILNFNDTQGAQTIPEGFRDVPGLIQAYNSMERDDFKGNFILVTGRQEYDSPLYSAFYNRWDAAGQRQYKRQSVLMPLKDVVSAVEAHSDPNWAVYKEFISDDLTSFWNESTDIKAMLLTDTLNKRGRGKLNQGVGDKMALTDARLGFLKKITDVVTRTVMDLAQFKDTCKDPMTEAPAAFRKGLHMTGTVQGDIEASITVDEFTSSGLMAITVIIPATQAEYKFAGRFNADDHRVALRNPLPEWNSANCVLSGHIHEVNSGVLFVGEINGKCGDYWSHDILTIVATDSQGSCGLSPSTTTDRLRSLVAEHFSENRHHVTNLEGKRAAADFIHATLKSYGMQIHIDKFDTEYSGYTGQNIVGIWRGTNAPEREAPVILGAHYDTFRTSPGVDDNGSGVAALLEAARIITSQPCVQDHTVVFVAFDLRCKESADAGMTACSSGNCGSKHFAEQNLVIYLDNLGIGLSKIRGVIIMDSILNYNNTVNSQRVPTGFENTPLWDELYEQSREEGFRGNFLAMFTRLGFDEPLYSALHTRWDEECDPQYKRKDILIPYKNIAEDTDTATDPYWTLYQAGALDLGSFWSVSGDIKGILLSDTESNRGRDVGRDEKLELTEERLGFLTKTTNVVTRTVLDLAGTTGRCRPPAEAAPEGFGEGLQLDGKLSLPEGERDYSLLVKTFGSTGRVDASLSNSTWSIDMSGHFDPNELILELRLQEPAWTSLSCVMRGHLANGGSGVLYSGMIDGSCSGAWPYGQVGFTLNSSIGRDITGGGGVGNGGLVAVGLIVGVILTLLVGAAVWFFRKRRPARDGPSFTPLPVST